MSLISSKSKRIFRNQRGTRYVEVNGWEDEMRRLTLLSALVVMIAAGCSSNEPLSIDIARPAAPPPSPVVLSGEAVDEGAVCAAGTVYDYYLEDMDGNTLGFNEWGDEVMAAMDAGTVAEAQNNFDVECDDG